jgi:hypothetical protein
MKKLKKNGFGGACVHVTHSRAGQHVCVYKYLVGKHEGETPLRKRGRIGEDEFKRSFEDI